MALEWFTCLQICRGQISPLIKALFTLLFEKVVFANPEIPLNIYG